MNFVPVARTSDIPPGEGRAYRVQDRDIALFNLNGSFYAIDNVCPHRGGPLAEGTLIGHLVTCPWHAWSFDVMSGNCLINPAADVASFEVRVENGEIQVAVF